MKSRSLLLPWLCIVLFGVPGLGSGANPDDVQTLIARARHTGDPVAWANYLMQADLAAEKLESDKASGCCGYRCVRAGSFELHYRYNGIQGQENYQHDLLQLIVQVHEGTPEGAEALVRLLPTGCQTIANAWTPYFKTVLGILEFRRWKQLDDPRLTRMRAEAYETWWSLSKAAADDPSLTDQGLNPRDFLEGAAQARERAIEAYRAVPESGHPDSEVMNHLEKLKTGQDTQQRKWFCSGD